MDERERAERELDELREAVLQDWVRITTHMAGAVEDMKATFSWRVTRPLRVFRAYHMKVAEVGALEATRIAASRIAEMRGKAG